MLTLEISDSDIVETRFRISPIFDLEHLVCSLGGPAPVELGPFWSDEVRLAFGEMRRSNPLLPVLIGLLRSRYVPSFLAPPPQSPAQTIEEDIDALLETPSRLVEDEIQRWLRIRQRVDPVVAQALSKRGLVSHLAELLMALWDRLLEPWWPFLRIFLEADIRWRSEQLVLGGWATALAELNPRFHRGEKRLSVDIRSTATMSLRGGGLVMMPSLFVRTAAAYTEPPWQPTIAYRARGSASILGRKPAASIGRLAPVLGRARSAILVALDTPGTPTSLSDRLSMSIGAVGDNLARLLDAGLVNRKRVGARVEYRRTPLGDALILSSINSP